MESKFFEFSKIQPIGFFDPVNLLDIYVPLTLEKKWSNTTSIQIRSFPERLLSDDKYILIIDNAGMGKSTIAKRIFIGACQYNKSISTYDDKKNKTPLGIPVFVDLRNLNSETNIIKYILNQIEHLSNSFDKNTLKYLLEHGKYLFILDGYDEIQHTHKQEVTKSISSFIRKVPHSSFIITSRQDNSLSAFHTFSRYSIRPLTEEESYQLINNLDFGGELAKTLIQQLKKDRSGVEEFLSNPLLITLLFTTWGYTPHLPHQKSDYYEQVYDALFYRHNVTKEQLYEGEKLCGLSK